MADGFIGKAAWGFTMAAQRSGAELCENGVK